MSEDWAAVAEEVREAFAEVGFQALLKKPGGTVPDPDTPPQNPFDPPDADPVIPPPAPDPVPVWAMFDSFKARHHETLEIRVGDVLAIVEAVAATPTQGDKLEMGGKDYAIVSVQREGPGFPSVMYECQCRAVGG